MMSISKQFNDEAMAIWQQFPHESRLMPAHYPDNHFTRGQTLLMLGMNPSFGARWIQNRISKHHRLGEANADLSAEEVFGWHPATGNAHTGRLLAIEQDAFENYGVFFDPQKRFAQAIGCGDSYSHLDLFHVRQTDQASFVATIANSGRLTLFGAAQIELTLRTIRRINPKVIVIANATAARMAVSYLGLQHVAHSGTQCVLPDLQGTRFFLAGMLSGARAMDSFSRIRLEDEVRNHLSGESASMPATP